MGPWKTFCTIVVITVFASQLFVTIANAELSHRGDTDPIYDAPPSKYVHISSVKTGRRREFAGGCSKIPDAPINGGIRCSRDSGCIATCSADYKFPNGLTQLAVLCVDKEWQVAGTTESSIPHCEPICLPECLNNGVCIASHQCNCPQDFTGPQCQFENKPCMEYPSPALNSQRICNSKSCTISCFNNFTFPDGTNVANLICKEGSWQPTRQDWVSVPDCEPVCDPPCQNAGNCLPSNLCQCPQAFRGPQCQYSADACSGQKIGFNGSYNCSGVDDDYSCTLSCPAGVEFEFRPAEEYKCSYATGIFEPQPIPQCKYKENTRVISFGSQYNSWSSYQDVFSSSSEDMFTKNNNDILKMYNNHGNNMSSNMVSYNTLGNNIYVIEAKRPVPKTCFTWGGMHYKTFNDKVFTFASDCSYILVQEAQNRLFTIIVENSPTCKTGDCFKIIKIFIQGKEYILTRNDEGVPELRTPKKLLPIPAQLSALRVELSAHFIVTTLDSLGIKLKWDGALMLQVEALENMWNKTVGLCGSMSHGDRDNLLTKNGDAARTIASFASSWRTETIGGKCDEYPNTENSCGSNPENAREARDFCMKLFSDRRFQACAGTIRVPELREACEKDYCTCKDENRRTCACDAMNVYVRQCAHKKMVSLVGWRNNNTCPMLCNNGRVYMPCGPRTESSCWTEAERKVDTENCEEGCFCPRGTVANEGKCITIEECPCSFHGKLFQPGKSVKKGCNTCTCTAGKWLCTQADCGARCAVIGDPHYTTFDGKRYDFMGKCKYYLMKGDDYSIQGENVPCLGAISESMGLVPSGAPSCTKTVTINFKEVSVKLKQNGQVLINGDDVTLFPTIIEGIRVRIASSIFLVVHLPNGLEVWWDGISRVYINAPPKFHGKTMGLCGTFTESQKDDFITPEGDIENVAISFANKWRTNESCPSIPEKESDHPCDLDPQKKTDAEKYCSYLKSDIFADCHSHVDPELFYKDCMYDMCSCKVKVDSCLCPTLAAYATECAAVGIKLLWRLDVNECKIHCPGSQVYQICGNSCTRSCGDISSYEECRQECVEGCNCPDGQTLDAYGECVPIGQCPCVHSGVEFTPGHREVRPGIKAPDLCTCTNGNWNCRPATPQEIQDYPAVKDLRNSCVASKHQEITDCAPIEPRTCHNMHQSVTSSKPTICKSGCVCKPGYVLDEPNGDCIPEKSCPCHHGGQSYHEGSVIQNDCNTCECGNSTWKCTERICTGVCNAWGDSHFKTFDGKIYQFQGMCDYVLAKGSLNREESFGLSIQNVPCGTTGVACSKSITLTVGSSQNEESIVLTRGKELPSGNFKRIAIRIAGLFVFIDVPDLGLTVQWDKGTRVYVRLDPKWKSRTKGLCGDYNDNSQDDFKTPSGGIPEVSANLFGDSWKKHESCPEPKDVKDPCQQHPERELWAVQRCGILKTPVFQPCHSEVEVEPYLLNCIFDTCGCDSGGDCECLCTALAAYAQECSTKGVPIKWRNQDLCPMQCDEKCSSYSPCVSTCPRETCDNLMILKDKSHLCARDTCVEGCSVKSCPENQVYSNDSYTECVPKETCRSLCTVINGITYYEGDVVSNNICQTCFCSRGKVVCKGEPCVTSVTIPSTVPHDMHFKCRDGWTAWINQDPAIKGRKFKDVEPLPTASYLASIENSAVCDKDRMVDIRCRSVKNQMPSKETGLDVECSLERGLYCKSQPHLSCVDFEISVLCQCSDSTVPTTVTPGPKECDKENLYKQHPTDCHLFYQCVPTDNGSEFVEKSCGQDMMYNPELQVCDWPASVIARRPECSATRTTTPTTTISTTFGDITTTTKICQDGETWSNCAINCNNVCHYYRVALMEEGYCNGTVECVPGCVPKERVECPPQKFWRDAVTCVNKPDCPCKSHGGETVLPGAIFKESYCETCQCINNYYTCDPSSCYTVITPRTTEKQPSTYTDTEPTTPSSSSTKPTTTPSSITQTIVVTSTVSPPADCINNNFIPLIEYLNDQVSFDASSTRGPQFKPSDSALNGVVPEDSAGHWEPEYINTNQWLDIRFQRPEPIYGITLQGSDTEDKFVTSYKVLFSENGHTFSYVLDDQKESRIFRGPVDKSKPVKQIFYQPVEAKVVRINPLSWHNGIAVKVELLGCEKFTITTVPGPQNPGITQTTQTTVNPKCSDSMGLENGLILPEQISASSSATDLLPNLKLTSANAWRPKLDNPHQFIKIDFLGPRNLTGIVTKGGDGSWTTVYKVSYSNDDRYWNPLISEDGTEVEFLGNFDSDTLKKDYFEKPIQARYLKVHPLKWHEHIALKLEVLGCFVPYPPVPTTPPVVKPTSTTEKPSEECNVCDGVAVPSTINCNCKDLYWWNGDACVMKQDCPCVVGHIRYNVGSAYVSEDCQECTCTLGGVSFCQPKNCEPCNEPGTRPVVNELCNCICKPCPVGTRHCPTSDACIDVDSWCNGVQDCPDDEKDCRNITTPSIEPSTTTVQPVETTTVTLTTASPKICPEPICPPGYRHVIKPPHYARPYTKGGLHSVFGNPWRNGLRKFMKHKSHRFESKSTEVECVEFTCEPRRNRPPPCPEVKCPPGYTVVLEKMSMYKLQKCPKYSCKPPPPPEAVCNVTGRTFNTFDNLEYKYDICNHILARDMFANKWFITLEKQCKTESGQCSRILVLTLDDDVIVLSPDMHVEINQNSLTPSQVTRVGSKMSPTFKISSVGGTTHLESDYYGFWLIWDSNSNVKLGITTKLARRVDGLCGYFDGYAANDKQLPDGSQARSTVAFGDSWAMEGAPECEPQVCPPYKEAESWKICNMVNDSSLAVCWNAVNVENFVSRCLESTCNCLRDNRTYDECRCRSLTSFVTECQAADFNLDLSGWRSTHDCPATCAPPFVHKDCFRKKCQTSCDNMRQVDPCPIMRGVCFPGCFCPEGTVRNGDSCVPPPQCRDCRCEWLGNSKYINFDRKNVRFDGNCTYVLSRDVTEGDKNSGDHTYQVLVSNGVCDTRTCTEAVTVLYDGHVVEIKKDASLREFQATVDGSRIEGYSYNATWLSLSQVPGEKLLLLIPSIQLEITSYQPNFAFTVTLPSHIFGGRMEGLCGNCNENPEDDLTKQDGKTTGDVQEFGSSWLVTESPQGTNIKTDGCVPWNPSKCIIPPADQDPCRYLLNRLDFGLCHNLVDPMPYLMACQDSMCAGGSYCDSFEAYARKCQQMDVCLIWRSSDTCPYACPPHLEYRPCESTCKVTCETIEKLNANKCSGNIAEGCFCPRDLVLHNGTCIRKEKCLQCDEEGHVDGDTWSPDTCTNCICNKRVVSCEKIECPAVNTICEENMTPVAVNGTEKDCCTKYLCVPETVTTVAPVCTEETQIPVCGYGQVMRVTTGADGCKKFICECVPPSECPGLNEISFETEELQPGFVRTTNTSGCCPRPVAICDQNSCPPPPACSNYYELTTKRENTCCADYECNPPKNLCLYNIGSDNKMELSEHVVAKKIGEKWMDGKCTSCTCELTDVGPKSKCSKTDCVKVDDHPDTSDFVLKEVVLPDKCCPNIERSACKDGDKIYNVGDVWQRNPEDSCTLFECVKDKDEIQKQIKVLECNNSCDLGFEYQPSSNKSITCCGRCVRVACVTGNQPRKIGEEWYSPDFCTKYSCTSNDENMHVVSVTEKCPEMSPWEVSEFEIEKRYVPGQCCPQFIRTACRHDGKVYKPGERWRSTEDKCMMEICTSEPNVTKYREVEICSQQCAPGWTREEKEGECCGKCRQTYCQIGDTLYLPGATWTSADNCTSYSCMEQGNQLSISSSYQTCPDITGCPESLIYTKNCCKMCNIPPYNQTVDRCAADVLDPKNTVGMFKIKHGRHGVCTNREPIEGLTQCRGSCESTTYFDTDELRTMINCQCCQPSQEKALIVELVCPDDKILKKKVSIPVSCSCSACKAGNSGYMGRKVGVKG